MGAVVPPRWARASSASDVFDEIRRGDLLVQHPTTRSARASSARSGRGARPRRDRDQDGCLRTSDESALIGSLIECAEEGKQSVCLVELKARFDERRNIEWSRAMEQAGVHVVHGFPDLKIHAKMTLVVRREAGVLRRYVHVGTGNYNASTARLYEDLGLFTADEEISADVADLFNYVTGSGGRNAFGSSSWRRSPCARAFSTRSVVSRRRRPRGSLPGSASKLNALIDPAIIEELYAASAAGVPIEGPGSLDLHAAPRCQGPLRDDRVTSVVGRFLEHSRIYWFEAGEDVSVYLAAPTSCRATSTGGSRC